MKQMFDAVNVDAIPANAQCLALYIDVPNNYAAGRARFPHAVVETISTQGNVARTIDSETGDLDVPQTIAWVQRMLAEGIYRPDVYADADRWMNQGLWTALAPHGFLIRRWVAAWNDQPVIPSGFDAHQYFSASYDASVVADNFFDTKPPPPPDPHHYLWYQTGPFPSRWGNLNERQLVLRYDGARKHPIMYRSYLKLLEARLYFLADRIAHEALKTNPHTWNLYFRGWRYQMLMKRVHGERLV